MAETDIKLTDRWTPLRYHAGQTRLFRSNARIDIVACGRRSGKTEIIKRRGVKRGLSDNINGHSNFLVVFAAPTRAQARSIFWDDLKALVPKQLVRQTRESEMRVICVHGTTYAVVGMDNYKSIEGQIVDDFNCDEFASLKQGVWSTTISPLIRTDGRPGRACLFGVPRPSVQMSELEELAQEDKTGEFAFHKWTTASVLPPEEIARARASMDPRSFATEFEASRVNVAGRAYYPFDRALHSFDVLPYNKRAPLIFTLDFNVEPGTAAVMQEHVDDSGATFTDVIGEVWIPTDSNTERVCRKLVEDWKHHEGLIYVDGDPAGGARKTSAGHVDQSGAEGTDWAIVRQVLERTFPGRVYLNHASSAPLVKVRVNAMNSRLITADGKIHMRFWRSRTKRVMADLEGVQWKEGAAGELEKHDQPLLTHLSDGIGYYIARVHPMIGHSFEMSNY